MAIAVGGCKLSYDGPSEVRLDWISNSPTVRR